VEGFDMDPNIARDLGPNTFLMYLILAGIGAAVWWVAHNLLIPVRDLHISFVKETNRQLDVMIDEQQKQNQNTTIIAQKIDSLSCMMPPRAQKIEPTEPRK
jgi:hypothetical protein